MTAGENKIPKFGNVLLNHETKEMYRLRTVPTYRNA